MIRTLILASLTLTFVSCGNNNSVNASTAAAACVTATACGIVDGGVSECTQGALATNNPLVASSAEFSPQMVNCIAAAGANCDAARRCLNGGQTPAQCTGSSSSCMGTVLHGCSEAAGSGGNKGTTAFDCADVQQMCVVNNNVAACGVGTCAGGPNTCVGTKIQACNNGILKQLDCADYNSTCVVTLGVAHCRGNGTACQTTNLQPFGNPIRCDGNVLVSCADSQEARYDCGVQSQKCVSNVNGQTFGCANGNACDPNTYSSTCTGNTLGFCNDGVISTYDCGAHGFKGCSPDNGGRCTL